MTIFTGHTEFRSLSATTERLALEMTFGILVLILTIMGIEKTSAWRSVVYIHATWSAINEMCQDSVLSSVADAEFGPRYASISRSSAMSGD